MQKKKSALFLTLTFLLLVNNFEQTKLYSSFQNVEERSMKDIIHTSRVNVHVHLLKSLHRSHNNLHSCAHDQLIRSIMCSLKKKKEPKD